ncbi:hypothetical protein BpHYR1_043362 [Brachionus plicatilis]|uniref:Uncharacterized protein n=1 Tax=Brachionus plicatilis TaxID=10195 RepID=A0A3M7RNA4_BRAPC|nr:hypothetical protein BpHYR1_043362 [Brachionus plicatilis]
MSVIGSIIEDIDSKKWKKIKALNICKAKSLAYSLDKVVAAYMATVAELKDIAESNDATDTRKSKCKDCISNFESKANKIKQIKLDADDVDEQKDDVYSEIDRLRLTNEELLLRNENLKEDDLLGDMAYLFAISTNQTLVSIMCFCAHHYLMIVVPKQFF